MMSLLSSLFVIIFVSFGDFELFQAMRLQPDQISEPHLAGIPLMDRKSVAVVLIFIFMIE